MNRICKRLPALACLSGWVLMASPVTAQDLIAQGVPGATSDLSGLTGNYLNLDNNTLVPQNLLGAFGSGIAYTGFGNRYIAVNDRGFANTDVDYKTRFQVFDIDVNTATKKITPTLISTRPFTNETGQNFVGQAKAFTGADPTKNLRLDPESVRYAPDGTFYVSDEYGPNIYHFNQTGQRIGVIAVPEKFKITNLSANETTEITGNTQGRVANRGMEGLALTPDGKTLYGIMQNPLIQDHEMNASGKRVGTNDRILKIDVATGKTSEYIYPLSDGANNGVNEIVAVNNHQFLVIERDGKAGNGANFKRIYKIDLTGATDVSGIGVGGASGLPQTGTGGNTAVGKSLLIDLLDPKFGLAGAAFPEKIEGLTFGPDLADGRHQLFVTIDNDLDPAKANLFWDFALDANALPDYTPGTFNVAFAAVPEPSGLGLTAALLGGSVWLAGKRRKARRA